MGSRSKPDAKPLHARWHPHVGNPWLLRDGKSNAHWTLQKIFNLALEMTQMTTVILPSQA